MMPAQPMTTFIVVEAELFPDLAVVEFHPPARQRHLAKPPRGSSGWLIGVLRSQPQKSDFDSPPIGILDSVRIFG